MPLRSQVSVSPRRAPRRGSSRPNPQQPKLIPQSYEPPIAGVITNAPVVAPVPRSARVIENMWVTPATVKPRGGSKHRVSVPSGTAEFLFGFVGNGVNKHFVANDANVYEFDDTTADGTTLSTTSITGQSNADYSALETTNDAGSHLHLVNGTDNLQYFDGTNWTQVTGVSTPAITGVDTDKFSHVWAHNSRVWFIEKGTLKAWYLGVNSISGVATDFSLAGVFNKGGTLLFGATWSSDSGDGFDDRWVVGTDKGEVAVYVGSDPSSASTWSLQGVYELPPVLDKNSHVNIGGDLVLGTKAGFIPLSAIAAKDPTQTGIDSLVRNISDEYDRQVTLAGTNVDWHFVKWDEQKAIMISPPVSGGGDNKIMVANVEPGGYSEFTGWNAESMAVLNGSLHFGDTGGKVYQAEQGGTDDGSIFECRICMAFDTLGAPANMKIAHAVRGVWRYRVPIDPKHSIAVDGIVNFEVAPNVATQTESAVGQWDVSAWDTAAWGEGSRAGQVLQEWENVNRQGRSLAVQLQLTSGQSYRLDCELEQIDILYEVGAAI